MTANSKQLTANKKTLKNKLLKVSDELAQMVYPLTYKFPREEKYVLGNQIRRAIISVPANIMEGIARGGEKEMRQFFNIAYASLKSQVFNLFCTQTGFD